MQIKTQDKIVQTVLRKMDERSLIGQKKYGATMMEEIEGQKKDLNRFLIDVQEELMDALLYIEAAISIYDAKEHDTYAKDTPCTYAVQFSIINNKLCMSVYMRSNDIWYGFCNDQYQFASLQEMIADRLSIETGWYYHHAHNMHLYKNKL